MLKRISLSLLGLICVFMSAGQTTSMKTIEIKNGEISSNFEDSIISIDSRPIQETFIDYLVWESISWGLVKLYADLDNYFPGSRFYNFDTVNVEHLMTHTSGYPNNARIANLNEEQVEYMPSEKYIHSEVNIELLKKIISVRHGSGFYAIFPEWLAKKGIEHTDFNTKYRRLVSTEDDIALWMQMWMDKTLLKPDLMKYFFEPQVRDSNKVYSYAWELIGDEVLLAFDENRPKEFMAIDVNDAHAIFAQKEIGFTREECIAMIGVSSSSGMSMFIRLLPLFLLLILAPVLYVRLKKRRT